MEKKEIQDNSNRKELPPNAIVAKNNDLIGKMSGFNLQELRLIAFCVAHLDSREGAENEKTICAKVSDLTHIFPMNNNSAYSVIKKAIKSISQKPMEFNDGRKLYLWNWFSGISYEPGAGKFEFCFNPQIEPFLLGLKGHLSKYRLYEVPFRSSLTWLLFENINCHLYHGRWQVGLDELRELLGVKGKYSRWVDFKKRCLDSPIVEINKHTNLEVGYAKVKTVRTVTAILFTMYKKGKTSSDNKDIEIENPVEYIYKILVSSGVGKKQADEIMILLDNSNKNIQVRGKIDGIVKRSKGKENKGGYIYNAVLGEIKQGYITSVIPGKPISLKHGQPSKQEVKAVAEKCYKREGDDCKFRKAGYSTQPMCLVCFETFPLDLKQ